MAGNTSVLYYLSNIWHAGYSGTFVVFLRPSMRCWDGTSN